MHSWTPGSTCPRPAPAAAPVSRPGAPPRGYPGNKSQTILENPGWLASGHISHEEEEYLLSAGLPQKGTLAPVVPAGFFLLPVPSAEPRMRPPPPPRHRTLDKCTLPGKLRRETLVRAAGGPVEAVESKLEGTPEGGTGLGKERGPGGLGWRGQGTGCHPQVRFPAFLLISQSLSLL